MKVATAFSGGFGSVEFALKYEKIKHEVIFAIEWMKPQRECYVLNHGNPRDGIYEDICDFNGSRYHGEIDLFHLSPPCTSFSMAGKREGLDSDTGDMMFQAFRAIAEVHPKIFVIENVASITSSNGGEDWNEILSALNTLENYTVTCGKMNAKEYGGIQNRHRMFIVGVRAKAQKMPFPFKAKRKYKLADFLEDKVDEKYYLSEKMIKYFTTMEQEGFCFKPMTRDDGYSKSLTSRYAKMGATDPYIQEDLSQVGNIDTRGHNSLWGRVYDVNGIAPNQNANGGGAGAKTGLFLINKKIRWYTYPHGVNKGGWRYLDICPSITTSSWDNNNFLEYNKRIRKLTPREAARVMGDFDDLFKMNGFSDTRKYEFIGNAIEINTYRHLLRAILNYTSDINFTEPQKYIFKRLKKREQKNTILS